MRDYCSSKRRCLNLIAIFAIFLGAKGAAQVVQAEDLLVDPVVETAAAGPVEFAVDTEKSSIGWVGRKVLGKHHGSVGLKSGTVTMQSGKLVDGSFVINMTSIKNEDLKDSPKDQAKLEGHLKSGDFFNVAEHPEARFEIDEVRTAEGTAVEVVGKLTVKGITVPLIIPATVTEQNGVYTAISSLEIDRTNWDIRYNSGKFFDPGNLGDKLIRDEISITLKIVTEAA